MHERILEAIQTLTVDAAALQHDALNTGRNAAELRPLVRDAAGVRDAMAELRRAAMPRSAHISRTWRKRSTNKSRCSKR
jgi:hypothetical protein